MPGVIWLELLLAGLLVLGLRRRYPVRPRAYRGVVGAPPQRNSVGTAVSPVLLATGFGLACLGGWAFTSPAASAALLAAEFERLQSTPGTEAEPVRSPFIPAPLQRADPERRIRPGDVLVVCAPILSLQLVIAGLVGALAPFMGTERDALAIPAALGLVLLAGAGVAGLVGLGLLVHRRFGSRKERVRTHP